MKLWHWIVAALALFILTAISIDFKLKDTEKIAYLGKWIGPRGTLDFKQNGYGSFKEGEDPEPFTWKLPSSGTVELRFLDTGEIEVLPIRREEHKLHLKDFIFLSERKILEERNKQLTQTR